MKVIGRPKAPLILTVDEREDLIRLTQRARVNRHLAFRAKLATGLPQFLITLVGAPATLGQVTLQLTWNASYDPVCAIGPGVTATPTVITTALKAGGSSGATLTVPAGTVVVDSATLTGPNAAGASGTVTVNWYSDSKCSNLAAAGSPQAITTSGALPDSASVTLAAGTYYPVVSYSGDAGNLASTSTCGDEVLQVGSSNHPPVANAGPDQKITVARCENGVAVTLDGSKSSDPDHDALTFVWTEGTTVLSKSAVAHIKLGAGVHTITLNVTDSHGATSADTVVVTVVDKSHGRK